MAKVTLKPGETLETALRRFRQRVLREGILVELRRRKSYESPSELRKRKKAAKKKLIARMKLEGR